MVRTTDRLLETIEGEARGRGSPPLIDNARVAVVGVGDVGDLMPDADPGALGNASPGGADRRRSLPTALLDNKEGMLDAEIRFTAGDFRPPRTEDAPVDFIGDRLDVVDMLLFILARY